MSSPFMHVSIRVPWHDAGWDGRVCDRPTLNGSCLRLKRIGQQRDDAREQAVRGTSIKDLDASEWPCCVPERFAFMAPFEYSRLASHPYNRGPDTPHGHFRPTPLRHPPFSAAAVPFAWMLRENMAAVAKEHGLDVHPDREPDLGFKKQTNWVQDHRNQRALSDGFANYIRKDESLCFFYAKHAPFVEDTNGRRILVAVGRVLHVAPVVEYDYAVKNLEGKLRSVLWERVIQHSIRPDFRNGFVFPYHALLKRSAADSSFDLAALAAFSPDDRLLEFSHASQLVTHDGALSALLACADSLKKTKGLVEGPWDHCLQWLDARIESLWMARGPCPGLGAALAAFGVGTGALVARWVSAKSGEGQDPWPLVAAALEEPKKHLPDHLAEGIGRTLSEKWTRLPPERRALLRLLSRFELSRDQAELLYVQEKRTKAGIDVTDAELLANPYVVFEKTRLLPDPISVWTVDRGVFPDETIRRQHPLPLPSAIDGGADARRVRALAVQVLEDAADAGSTLLPTDRVVLSVRELTLQPPCPLDADLINVARNGFGGVIEECTMANGAPALQLARLADMGGIIRNAVEKRIKGARLPAQADWRKLLDVHLATQGSAPGDELEESARAEKTAALAELAGARLSVLIGPAGTGKTTLLSVLCSHPHVSEGGVVLLAPTGKARVRMEQATRGLALSGYTVAQFLSPDRYNSSTGRYTLSTKTAEVGARTVIVDEASMMTEEMLAALLQALKGVHRLILIGDPRQLPPIGAGRPFVDIVNRLAPEGVRERFPRVGSGYAELTIRRRQAGQEREDLQFAEWFSGSPIAPGEDAVFDQVIRPGESKHVRFVQWEGADDLRTKVLAELIRELKLAGIDDIAGFDATLGGTPWNDVRFFNFGAAEKAEGWQILSPVRSGAHGVPDMNRLVHKQFRQVQLEASRKERNRKYPKPMGPEEIVYGDKVINVVNTDPKQPWFRHRRCYPEKENPYIANGEIGMVEASSGRRDFRTFGGSSRSSSRHSRSTSTTSRTGTSARTAVRFSSWRTRSPCTKRREASSARCSSFSRARAGCCLASCSTPRSLASAIAS